MLLLADAIGALASFGPEGLDGEPRFLHRPSHEPAHGVSLPAHPVHDLDQRGAVFRKRLRITRPQAQEEIRS